MPEPPKQPVDIPFPISGIVEGSSHTQQPLNTTWDAKNVVPFDPEEDRARGGRRNGVEKVTGLPVSTERLQMVKSVGIVPGDANVRVAGSISSFSSDQTMGNLEGYMRYSTLPDGGQLNLTAMGHKFYGACCKRLNGGSNQDGGYSFENDWALGVNSNYYGAVYSANSLIKNIGIDYAHTLDAWRDDFANGHSGVTKQTDDNGFAYISVQPCMFPVNPRITYPQGDPRTWWETYGNGLGFLGSINQGTDLCINNVMSLTPDVISDQHPWDSSSEREFVSRVEFMFPKTHGPTESSGHNNNPELTFKHSAADVTDARHIYDPWYTEVVGSSQSAMDDVFAYGGWNPIESLSRFGFVFRIGGEFDSDPDTRDDWANNTTLRRAVGVYFERKHYPTDTGKWELMAGEVMPNAASTGNTFTTDGPAVAKSIELGTEDGQVDRDEYHTLEVRLIKNKLEILFNGASAYSVDDLMDTAVFDRVDNTGTRGHSMFFYESNHSLASGYTSSSSPSDSIKAHAKRQLAYWASRDWNARKVDGVSAASNDSKYDCSDELRIRSWTWHEVGGIVSVPQNTIASSGGYIYGAPNQTAFARISTKQDLNANQNMVNAVEYFQKMYFVDGENYKVYEPEESAAIGHAGTISDWNAENGDLPGGDGSTGVNGSGTSDGNARCPIIATWLGRIVLSGKGDDPQNWFMSAVGDPLDWDYLTGSDETGAVKGSSTRQFGKWHPPSRR